MEEINDTKSATKPSPMESRLISGWVRFSFLHNKFLLTGIGFIIWMFFIDRNDLPTQWKRIKELNTLQQNEKTIDKQINETKIELSLLKTNPSTLEKYAREKYMMKKENEDLYIITPANQ
jgi:cell division protein FtsB